MAKAIKIWPAERGFPYHLAIDGIVDWRDTDQPDQVRIKMSRGKLPIVAFGTSAELDTIYASAMQSPLPEAEIA